MTNEKRPDETPELEPEAEREAEPELETEPDPETEPERQPEPEPTRGAAKTARPTRPTGAGGYRGALPPRDDRLAAPWLAVVVVLFVMMFVLAFLDVPNRFFAEDTPPEIPAPTIDLSPEPSPAAS